MYASLISETVINMYTAVFETSISCPGLWLLLSNGEEK